jgi:hypothetical protein
LVGLGVTASFIVVAALTGMRLRQLLGVDEDCLVRLPLEDGSDDTLRYVRGILVKTAGTPHGERSPVVASIDGFDNHVRAAVELIRGLTAGLRKRSGEKRLSTCIGCANFAVAPAHAPPLEASTSRWPPVARRP